MDQPIKRIITLAGFLVLGASWACKSKGGREVAVFSQKTQPNVVIIMADDLGYNDLSCYGSNSIKTPNIDRLAASGLRLTDYHSNGAVCSPTRASLMTGLYPQEAGVEGVITAKSHRDTGMSLEKFTLAEYLRDSGYATGLIGKWHLGYKPEFGPNMQGFDQFVGFVSGNIDYFSHIDQEGFEDWWNNQDLEQEAGYLTDLITDKALKYLEQRSPNQPFLLYLAHGAPHSPYQGPNDQADRTVGGDFPIQGSREDKQSAYKEMIESLDTNVGRVVECLEENQLIENTLIIFCSDNGGTKSIGSNAPFSGFKGQLYEGGHRVPAIFYWKNTIPQAVSDELILSMDLFPTVVSLLGLEVPQGLSGKNLAGIVDGTDKTSMEPERIVFWRFGNQAVARKGDWKLLKIGQVSNLYNLSTDTQEATDVKEAHPDIFRELTKAYEDWETGLTEEIISF